MVYRSTTYFMEATTQKVGLGFEMKQMLKLLGAQMYKGNEANVAVKELLQNSFDAVKKVINPEIRINTRGNTITVKDNGIGMSRETVENVYLKIGGTLKDHLDVADRSGGLGLAKVQFFMTASHIYVKTVKDGTETILSCTQEELLLGDATLDCCSTGEPNGTLVKLTFPEFVEDLGGQKKQIRIESYRGYYSIMEKPLLLDGLSVYWNDSLVDMSIPRLYDMSLNFSAVWGDMNIYLCSDLSRKNDYRNMIVLSAGLYQFQQTFSECPLPVLIDIKPKVKAGDLGYPFNNTREDFNVYVREDIKVMKKYLADIYSVIMSKEIEKRFSGLVDLDFVDPKKNLTDEERLQLSLEKKVNRLKDDNHGVQFKQHVFQQIMQEFGHLAINGEISYVEKDIVKEATLISHQGKVNLSNDSTIKFHNNTTGDYGIEGAKSFLEDYASLIKSALNEPEIRERYELFQDEKFVVGIAFDKEFAGCFLKGNINALFLNPMCGDVQCEETFIGHFMHTLIHEIAHHTFSRHDSDFCRAMGDVNLIMYKTGMYGLYEKFARVIINRHQDTYKKLYEIYAASASLNNALNPE